MASHERLRPSQVLNEYAAAGSLNPALVPFVGEKDLDLAGRLAQNPFLMAPMAGVTDGAYRLMARAGGAALAYSEMVSVAGIHYGGDKTWELVYPADGEPDIAVQLFGSKPEQFREAAAAVSERLGNKLALIDINMACPVPKVTKKGEGSALLDNPSLAAELVGACVAETSVPVTCKIRQGRRAGEEVAPEFARSLEQAGAAAVAVHGRTASQLYRGKADWGAVQRVAAAVSVPVIGTGDIMSHEDACSMMQQTGAAAAMIARGSYGNPWAFSGRTPASLTIEERLGAFECHVRLLGATGAHLARARSLAGWYFRGMPHAAAWRERAMHCADLAGYLNLIEQMRELAQRGSE